jgi:hypothetical protein
MRYAFGMRRIKRILTILFLAVSAAMVTAAIPSFSDLQASPAQMTSHHCECPDGCPPDGADCPAPQPCSIVHGGIAMAAPPPFIDFQSASEERFSAFTQSPDPHNGPPAPPPPRR